MLILGHRKNEGILIGDDIRIAIIECVAGGVHLVTDVPKQASITREELSEAEQTNKYTMSPNVTPVRSLHAALKQYILKNGDGELP